MFICKTGFRKFKFLSYPHIGEPEIQNQIDLIHGLVSLVNMGHIIRTFLISLLDKSCYPEREGERERRRWKEKEMDEAGYSSIGETGEKHRHL